MDALSIVLDAGSDPCTADVHGAYPIHYAAQMSDQKTDRDGRLSASDKGGRVGLSALKKLVSCGVPVDVVDRDGRQPLLWAASSGKLLSPIVISVVTERLAAALACPRGR